MPKPARTSVCTTAGGSPVRAADQAVISPRADQQKWMQALLDHHHQAVHARAHEHFQAISSLIQEVNAKLVEHMEMQKGGNCNHRRMVQVSENLEDEKLAFTAGDFARPSASRMLVGHGEYAVQQDDPGGALAQEKAERERASMLKKLKRQAYQNRRDVPGQSEESDDAEPKTAEPRMPKSETMQKIHGALKTGKAPPLRGSFLVRVVEGGSLDLAMGSVVIFNAILTIVHSEWLGTQADASLGFHTGDWGLGSGRVFEYSEDIFLAIYMIEILARIFVVRRRYMLVDGKIQWHNILDAAVVGSSILDRYIMPIVSSDAANLSLTRMFRMLRLSRTLRIMRVMTLFSPLRVLAATFVASIGALFWSLILLLILNIVGGLILCQSLHSFVVDATQDFEDRLWVNRFYGNAAKSIYTMFEVTNSGGWPNYARPLIEKVSGWYASFYMLYVSLVIFAIIRIISALFLKETLAAAQADAAFAVQETAKHKEKYKEKLHDIFREADVSGDGVITREEFEDALENPVVLSYFGLLEIEIHEVEPLFDLLDDGDGQVTISEFCNGIMRLKGQARALDVISIMHDANIIISQCREMKTSLGMLEHKFGVDSGVSYIRFDARFDN
eukprot:TRINITY_DN20777_c0_g2_i1.p1 TRINITY_DN20777_c0_g2~~TRINITY_DN20777_c0_g2_i1.p1  ORF type:complete len:616 (-),score=112.55 TRINITY_DN20777_c0_g2_i1:236-2083(-)